MLRRLSVILANFGDFYDVISENCIKSTILDNYSCGGREMKRFSKKTNLASLE
jgi:hypothetical protein